MSIGHGKHGVAASLAPVCAVSRSRLPAAARGPGMQEDHVWGRIFLRRLPPGAGYAGRSPGGGLSGFGRARAGLRAGSAELRASYAPAVARAGVGAGAVEPRTTSS